MQYGNFDDRKKEYVITAPDTPLPWINYLGNDDYFALISNTAGGYSFFRDARLRRITRYRYNNVPYDQGGRYLYLRDDQDGTFWSPSWQPTYTNLENYSCRHGLGYTVISSENKGIKSETTYFVPLKSNLEIWRTKITNNRKESASISLFSLVEFCLWDALDDSSNFQRNFNIGEVEIEDNVIYHKTEYRERRDHFAYFACSVDISGFETSRDAFLGPYRSFSNPQTVENGKAANSIAHGWAPIGSHHIQLNLKPGQEKEIIFILGYAENPKNEKFDPEKPGTINKSFVKPVIKTYLDPAILDQKFQELAAFWEKVLNVYQVNTPDEDTNRMVNIWNAYQCMVTFNMSRSASYFESGIGRGMGFRDSNQDLLGFVQMVPEKARQRLLDLAATQLPSGGAYHQYQPLTKRGNDAVGSNFNDDPLWLVLAATAYIKETGDKSILDEMVPYDNQSGTEKSFFDHLERAIQYILDRRGPHQLPLIGRADWNDCLNLNCFSEKPGESFQTTENKGGGVAESIFIAGLFVIAAKEMAELAAYLGDTTLENKYADQAKQMETAVLNHGWDGDWYLRAYDYFGDALGSKNNKEGQIFIEPQGICIMAEIGKEQGYPQRSLDAVKNHLDSKHGIVLHQPAFTQYDLKYGEITSYPPGYKENAGIFCHTNPWIMIAETVVGNGDRAFDYYKKINPSNREKISETHRSEPYVYAQMIAGKDAATHGEAKNSWLTGTAAWNYVAISQYILGIRPNYEGLTVNPVLPSDWPGFTATRQFREKTFNITCERADVDSPKIFANEVEISGTTIPVNSTETDIQVKILIPK